MGSDVTFRLVALALLLVALSISITFRRRASQSGDQTSARREEGAVIFTLRSLFGLALWFSVFAYLVNPGWMAWADLPLPVWVRWLGAVLMAICLPLFYWLFSSLGKNMTSTVAIREAHTMVTHGPYRWVRHPLYSTGVLFFAGLSLLAANWLIVVTMLGGFIALMMRTSVEEAKLIERFGDEYRAYMERTGRYIPRLNR